MRTEFISRVYQTVLDESTVWYHLRVAWCSVERRASCAEDGVHKQHPCCRAWGLGRCSSTQRAPRGAEHMLPEPNDYHLSWVNLCSKNVLVKCSLPVLDVKGLLGVRRPNVISIADNLLKSCWCWGLGWVHQAGDARTTVWAVCVVHLTWMCCGLMGVRTFVWLIALHRKSLGIFVITLQVWCRKRAGVWHSSVALMCW